jgi:hypothetical protein
MMPRQNHGAPANQTDATGALGNGLKHTCDRTPMRGTNRTCLALLTVGLLANITGCSDPGMVTVQTELRQAPAAGSKVLVVIPKGGAISVGDCGNGWCRVSWNGRDGYILSKSMRLAEGAHRNTPEANQPALSDDESAPEVPPVPSSSAD